MKYFNVLCIKQGSPLNNITPGKVYKAEYDLTTRHMFCITKDDIGISRSYWKDRFIKLKGNNFNEEYLKILYGD